MPQEVNVATDPMIVYAMVAVFGVAIVLALVFVRPRRGLGAVERSEVPDHVAGGQPWMPGGDIFGGDPQPSPQPEPPASLSETWPAADPWGSAPPAPGPQQPLHDPWSTGATDPPGPQPRWDKR